MIDKRTTKNTGDRILDAAEKVFSNRGFDGASMRDITARAGVNLPTIYYHFGSKHGLMQAVLNRCLVPLQKESMERLRRSEEENDGKPVPVEKILEALLFPPLHLAASGTEAAALTMQLIGRIMSEPDPKTQEVLFELHKETRMVFGEAFAKSLPDLPKSVQMWRNEFAWGMLGAILSGSRRIHKITDGVCNPLDFATTLAEMTHFLAAGFRAPVGTTETKTRSIAIDKHR